MKLKDKVAIVTGGNQGIGKAIALAMAKEGAKVVIVARNAVRLKETLSALQSLCPYSLAIEADIGEESQIKDMVHKVWQNFGRIDILVNNASITGPTKSAVEISAEEWEEVLRINLLGTVFCCREVLRIMMQQRSGRGRSRGA
ncbi:MAG: SDR family NAD(P)-dependent oxidoreductase [Deltaproteobacteria bacterium]|nr:SDR family NAD(P)-dependent oxidoreductase [Deltaproteobacteria bacterium]